MSVVDWTGTLRQLVVDRDSWIDQAAVYRLQGNTLMKIQKKISAQFAGGGDAA